MKLYEYEGKEIFARYGIAIPKGRVVSSHSEVPEAIKYIGLPAVVKAQVLVGGRGKAGGVKIVNSVDEAIDRVKSMIGSSLRGAPVRKVLIEEAVDIDRELYLSLTVDRSVRKYIILASREGGVDIEEIAARSPESIVRIHIDPLIGLRDFHVRRLMYELDLPEYGDLYNIVRGLYSIMLDLDADLVEINPLVITREGRLIALDSKITIDDNAYFRHQEFFDKLMSEERDLTEEEIVARKYGFSYVKLDGDIGIIGNGAGLTMATMDLVRHFGGSPANFLDIGGGANRERVKNALSILLNDRNVRAIFINVYGGITRCDEVAIGIVEALKEHGTQKPMVVRLVGTEEEKGRQILEEHGIRFYVSDEEAAKAVVEIARRG